MFCHGCGCSNVIGTIKCTKCGRSFNVSRDSYIAVLTKTEGDAENSRRLFPYATFADRVKAGLLDAAILSVVEAPLTLGVRFLNSEDHQHQFLLATSFLVAFMTWLYYPLLESSKWQATLGKKILGLQVTDVRGERITFLRAAFKQLIQSVIGTTIYGTVFFLYSSVLERYSVSVAREGAENLAIAVSVQCPLLWTALRHRFHSKETVSFRQNCWPPRPTAKEIVHCLHPA